MNKIRVGVIGAGSIAQSGHLPFYAKNKNVELAAIADLNLDRAVSMARKFDARKVYHDAEEMLQKEKLHAVSICTANNSHVPLALMAIRNGTDVLVEKPLGVNYDEAAHLVEESEEAGRICMVGMTHRFRNDARVMKRFIEAGDLGNIYYVKTRILRSRGTPMGWFTNKAIAGGGPLMDIGVHALDLAWWLVGQPEIATVSGQMVQGIGNYRTEMLGRWHAADSETQNQVVFDVEDFASAYLRFNNGIVLHLEVSWAINGPQDESLKVEVYGTKGGMTLVPLRFFSEKNQIFGESGMLIKNNDPMEEEINHFISAVMNRTQPLITARQGAEVIKMLDSIKLSSSKQAEIHL